MASIVIRRTIVLVLLVRVLAAPLSLRPDLRPSPASPTLIVRICAWPAQRLARFSVLSGLLQSLRGRNGLAGRAKMRRLRHLALRLRNRLLELVECTALGGLPEQALTGRLRC